MKEFSMETESHRKRSYSDVRKSYRVLTGEVGLLLQQILTDLSVRHIASV